MMRHGRRTLLLLVVVFVGLAALLTAQNQQLAQQPFPTPARTFTRLFPELEVLDILSIRLLDPATNTTFTIQRGEYGTWQPLEQEGTLQENAGTNIARTVALLPYERTLPLADDTSLADYGFEPTPTMLIQFVLITGEAHGIIVGGLAASGTGFYGIVDNREEMFLLVPEAVAYLITQLRSPPIA
jgi:hypothetical protein